MADYRMYSLDREGRIDLAVWYDSDTDEEAITRARKLRSNALRCEIWRNRGLVTALNAETVQ